jgi:hypothetical protein
VTRNGLPPALEALVATDGSDPVLANISAQDNLSYGHAKLLQEGQRQLSVCLADCSLPTDGPDATQGGPLGKGQLCTRRCTKDQTVRP